jgi:methionyl-tRNA formyltransferase
MGGDQLKALVLTSTSPRHQFFVQQIAEQFEIAAIVCEQKRNYYVQQRESSEAICAHFYQNAAQELICFNDVSAAPAANITTVPDINAPEVMQWVSKLDVDVVCLFGTSILKAHWLSAFPDKIVNLHLGLSPWYRGSATLFWPFADSAAEFLGTTIHLAVEKVDAGAILHRVKPRLKSGENYYQISNQLIRQSIEVFPGIVIRYLEKTLHPQAQENVVGRICRKTDFDEAALVRALRYVGDGFSSQELRRIKEAAQCLCLP